MTEYVEIRNQIRRPVSDGALENRALFTIRKTLGRRIIDHKFNKLGEKGSADRKGKSHRRCDPLTDAGKVSEPTVTLDFDHKGFRIYNMKGQESRIRLENRLSVSKEKMKENHFLKITEFNNK